MRASAWSIALVAVTIGSATAHAGWPVDGAAVSVLPCEQSPTAAVSDGRGGVYVLWTDNRTCSHNDVYVQRLTGSGAVAAGWPDTGLPVCPLITGQGSATAVPDDAGGAIVVWTDGRFGQQRLFAQRIRPDGTRSWNADGVAVCDAGGTQGGYRLLRDGAGGAFISWMDTRRGLTDDTPHHHPLFDLYAQRIDAAGARLWGASGDSVATNALVEGPASLVTDGGSGVLLTWPDERGISELQHLDASGTAQLAYGGVTIPGKFLAAVVSVTSDGAGGIIAAFMDGPDTQGDLYAQRVDANGTLQWAMNGVLVAGAAYDQRPNDIIPDGSGGAFIAWYDLRNGQDWDVYVQRITAAGGPAPGWPTGGRAVCTAPGFQIYPRLVSDSAGGCIVTWYDARDPAAAYDIYAQRITSQAGVSAGWPANGARLCHASGDQSLPLPVPDGAGGALVAWSDYRAYADVYAQRVGGSGVVGDTLAVTAVEPPPPIRFGIGPIHNPLVRGDLQIAVSVPDASPAELSLFDLNGRRVARQAFEGGGATPVVIRLKTPGGMSSGLYLVQLRQGGRAISRKVSVVR